MTRTWFDPITGEWIPAGEVEGPAWKLPKTPGWNDWAMRLKRQPSASGVTATERPRGAAPLLWRLLLHAPAGRGTLRPLGFHRVRDMCGNPIAVIVLLPLLSGLRPIGQTYRVVDAQSGRAHRGAASGAAGRKRAAQAMPFVLYRLALSCRRADDRCRGHGHVQGGRRESDVQSEFQERDLRASLRDCRAGPGVKICYPDEYREISVKPVGGVVEIPLPNRRPGLRGPGFLKIPSETAWTKIFQ